MSKVRTTLRRHFYFVLSCVCVLGVLLIVGGTFVYSKGAFEVLDVMVTNNAMFFLAFRLCMYTLLFVLWKPIVVLAIRKSQSSSKTDPHEAILSYRYKVLCMVGIYEVFVAQNIIGRLI